MKLKIQNVLLITIVATMIVLSSLNYNIARTSAYVEEYDGLYEIYYDDGNPEFSCYWTYIGARECGFAVRFTPPFTPLLIVGACFYLYDAYDFIVAVYDENRNEIYREEFQVVPEDRGAEDWFSVEFTEPIRIDEGDFYIALILKTPAHPKLGADSTPPYNGRSYWIHEEDGSVVWETGEEVAAEEGWTPSDFCISALVTPLDTDGDGLYDHEEKEQGTDVQNPDTDGDGLEDGEEVNVYQTDPLKADTDSDGLKDGVEVLQGFDPKNPDMDDDGLLDGDEISSGTDVKNPDTDGDGLEDGEEVNVYQTDPLKADTDGDGLKDGVEVLQGFDPKDPDMDDDGLLDGDEVSSGTDVKNPDTDGDGLKDGDEVHKYKTNPKIEDTDMDGLVDGTEVNMRTNPLKADTDGDGLKDSVDPMPTSALIPNGLIGLGVIVVALVVFFLRRRPKPAPRPPAPAAPAAPPPTPLRVRVVPVCPKCGAEIPEGAEYCPECGAKLKK